LCAVEIVIKGCSLKFLIAQIYVDSRRLRRVHHDLCIASPSRCENGFWTQIKQ
jgi:hypothetical protein